MHIQSPVSPHALPRLFYGMVMAVLNGMEKAFQRNITTITIDNTDQVSISEVIESERDFQSAREEINEMKRANIERMNSADRKRTTERDPHNIGR